MVAILSYNMGMNVVKLGFLFQYRRIFQDATMQRICYWLIIFVCFWAALQASLLGVACLPISILVPSMAGKCLDTLPVWYFSSGMSMATDIIIFAVPIPSVLKLQLRMKQRIIVLGIFCLGFL
jgi:rhodopsin domain-containing protein